MASVGTDSIIEPWLSQATQTHLGLSQVLEDAEVDQWVADQLDPGIRIAMIASGGCTAAALAASPKVSHIHLVDVNPAQIPLARLKLHLLFTAAPALRLAILGHSPLSSQERTSHLKNAFDSLHLPHDALGPIEAISEKGADHAGRYDIMFQEIRRQLHPYSKQLEVLLGMQDPVKQMLLAGPATEIGDAIEKAFDSVFSHPQLIKLFGKSPIEHSRPFSIVFLYNLWRILATRPAAENPYLTQVFLGRFAGNASYPWLTAPIPSHRVRITWEHARMSEALGKSSDEYDLVHFSNIVDWMAPEESSITLDHAWRLTRPGGMVIVRQIFPVVNIPSLSKKWEWQTGIGEKLRDRDRSFLYRIYVGKKPE